MAKVTEMAAQLAQPFVEAAGCSLWDVEYVKEAGEWYLRFYIDKDGRLVVCFDEYDVAPGAMGAQSFTVSREAIAGLLR